MKPFTASTRPVALEVGVPSEDLTYPVWVGGGLLSGIGARMKRATPRAKRVALITDQNVMKLYGHGVRASLSEAGGTT